MARPARHQQLSQAVAQVGFYSNVRKLEQDVNALLQSCTSLQPQAGTFSSGSQMITLFYLHGTVPINFQGNTYNIPMTIYFDPPYPQSSPRCFVTPTAGMTIKEKHRHVDANGMTYLPYLNEWGPQSSLLKLVETISQTFGGDPPIYSTSAAPGGAATAATQAAAVVQGVGSVVSSLAGQVGGLVSGYGHGRASSAGYAQPYGQQQYRPPAAQSQYGGTAVGTAVPVVQPTRRPQPTARQRLEAKAVVRLPAVLRPLEAELAEEKRAHEALTAHAGDVREAVARLEAAAPSAPQLLAELDARSAELEQWLATNEAGGPAALAQVVEQATEPRSPLQAQLLDLVSEEAAYDDWLHALEDQLRDGKVGLEAFVRDVRNTSRQQFLARALRIKVTRTLAAQTA